MATSASIPWLILMSLLLGDKSKKASAASTSSYRHLVGCLDGARKHCLSHISSQGIPDRPEPAFWVFMELVAPIIVAAFLAFHDLHGLRNKRSQSCHVQALQHKPQSSASMLYRSTHNFRVSAAGLAWVHTWLISTPYCILFFAPELRQALLLTVEALHGKWSKSQNEVTRANGGAKAKTRWLRQMAEQTPKRSV